MRQALPSPSYLPGVPSEAPRERDFRRFVWPVVALIAVVLLACFAVNAMMARENVIGQAERNAANVARLLDHQVSAMMGVADVMVRTVGAIGEGDLPVELTKSISEVPYLDAVHVIDVATGSVLRDTRGLPHAHPGIIDLEALQAASKAGAAGVRVGPPVKAQGGWSFGLSRRMTVGGRDVVVVAHMSLARLAALFETVDTGPDGCVSLFNAQGLLMLTAPADPSQIGRDLSKMPILASIREHAPGGTFSESGLPDGIVRIVSFSTVEPADMVVAVGMSQDVVLAAWRSQVARDGGFIMLLIALILFGGLLTDRLLRRRSEALGMLGDSEAFLRGVLEGSGDCIVVLDEQGRVSFVNEAGMASLEIEDFSTHRGRRFASLFDGPHQAEVAAAVRRAQGAGAGRVTAPCPDASGGTRWWDVMITPLGGPGGAGRADRLVAVSRDVTEQKRVSEELLQAKRTAEEATQAKSEFLSSMSHELRTPLNGILGITEILLRGKLDDRSREFVRQQAGACRQLQGIINNVLDFTKIEEGRLDLRKSSVALAELLDNCVSVVAPTAAAKSVSVAAEVAPELPGSVVLDELRVRQVVLNFLSNAVRHTAHDTQVVVRATHSPSGGLRIAVSDMGPGIPRGREHLLFVKFSQITPSEGGSGLGLALAKRFATAMGGSVGFEREPSRGATFYVDLPLDASVPTVPAPPPPAPEALPPAERARVLLVEDTDLNRMVIEAMLQDMGHQVVSAVNGERAVELARSNDFDIVFMDVQMPVMGGLEATAAIRGLPGPRGRVPIAALTANSFRDEIERCLAAGMDAHLAKPVDATSLAAAVARFVPAREPERSCA